MQEVGVYDPMEQAGHADMVSKNVVLEKIEGFETQERERQEKAKKAYTTEDRNLALEIEPKLRLIDSTSRFFWLQGYEFAKKEILGVG